MNKMFGARSAASLFRTNNIAQQKANIARRLSTLMMDRSLSVCDATIVSRQFDVGYLMVAVLNSLVLVLLLLRLPLRHPLLRAFSPESLSPFLSLGKLLGGFRRNSRSSGTTGTLCHRR